jgi:uracil-DNA glycosylase family 4
MNFQELDSQIIHCRLCPRLVQYREKVHIRACEDQNCGWRKPVPGFGDEKARLLIIGLAPSIEGANRTGRIFTGDASSDFLIKNLYLAKMANQPTSESRNDGLKLKGCYLTAVVKCTPPNHRPSPVERKRCSFWARSP